MNTISREYILNLVKTEWERATKIWEAQGKTVHTPLTKIVIKRMTPLGTASSDGTIEITTNYIGTQLFSEMLDTIRHEICHLLVGIRMKHNDYWQNACYVIGCRAKRSKEIKDDTYYQQAYKYILYAINDKGERMKLGFRNRKDKKYTQASKNAYIINGFGYVERFLYQPQ